MYRLIIWDNCWAEEEKDTICQLFGDSRGLTFTDEVLDIIGIRNV